MFEFMVLQCICIALIIVFPKIVTTFPEQLREESAAIKTEDVDDSMNRLETDHLKDAQDEAAGKDGEEEGGEAEEDLEKDPMSNKSKK
jgi:hypothetical protein